MSKKEIRRRCQALVADLDIPVPFDAQELCARIATRRGRPIRLRAVAMPMDSPCGIWLSTAGNDYIFYEAHTSRLHQEHIIVHEIGHVLCDHYATAVLSPETSRLLLPNLDPALVNRVLSRGHCSAEEEQEAEMIASLILRRASRWQPESEWTAPADGAGVRQRLGGSLEPPDHWGRP
jgi:IrrE N-terminal-like domain